MKEILTILFVVMSILALGQDSIPQRQRLDAYEFYKLRAEIEENVKIVVDSVYCVEDKARSNPICRIHIDYSIQNNSDFDLNKVGFELLIINQEDSLVYQVPISYYNTVQKGRTIHLKRIHTLNEISMLATDQIASWIIILEDVLLESHEEAGRRRRYLLF